MSLNQLPLTSDGRPNYHNPEDDYPIYPVKLTLTLLKPNHVKCETVKGKIYLPPWGVTFVADVQVEFDDDTPGMPINTIDLSYETLHSHKYTRSLLSKSITLNFSPSLDSQYLCDAKIVISPTKDMDLAYKQISEGKVDDERQQKIAQAIRGLADEGYAVYNGPKV
ncbi:hypothetical protein IAT38_007319 [Cryptococcus sp. DSM 104549]